jgi:hypothetical protein
MIFRKTTISGPSCRGLIGISIYASLSVLFAALVSCFGFAQGTTLSPPSVIKQLASGMDRTTWNVRKWSGRYLVVFHRGDSDAPEFALYDQNDHVVVRRAVTVGDAKTGTVGINAVAADESGNSYVAAAAVSNSGAIARFIEKFDANGQGLGVIRTNPFQAEQMCSTGDGTVWALGWDEVAERRNVKHAGYPILRHFDFARGETAATLQREQVHWDFLNPTRAFLACNSKSVGLYLASDGFWLEVDADGHSPSLHRLPPIPRRGDVTGGAFTEAGGFFLRSTAKALGLPS